MGRVWGHFRGVSLESCAPFFSGLGAFFLFGVFRCLFAFGAVHTPDADSSYGVGTCMSATCGPQGAKELPGVLFLHMAQNRQDPFSSSLSQLFSFWFQGVSLSCQINNWISEAGCLDRVSFRARRVDLRTHGRAPALRATRKRSSEAPGDVAQVLKSNAMFAARRSPGLPSFFWHIHVRRAKPDLFLLFEVNPREDSRVKQYGYE